jgi:6-phosphogluconolactonase
MSNVPSDVVLVLDREGLALEAARRFSIACAEAIRRGGRFTVALSGGSSPLSLYTTLASEAYRSKIHWDAIHVFWGDERCVPPDHAESNYKLVYDTLLKHVPIPPSQIHRMRGEDPDPEAAAIEYEQLLRPAFQLSPGDWPRFDLVLLGMGADGHTASLLPGSPVLREVKRLVVACDAPSRWQRRLTLTLPVINSARTAIVLVAGKAKEEALRRVLHEQDPTDPLPAQLVRPRDGRLIWLIDEESAQHSAISRQP